MTGGGYPNDPGDPESWDEDKLLGAYRDVAEALREAVRIIARLENDRRTREGQDFLIRARRALVR